MEGWRGHRGVQRGNVGTHRQVQWGMEGTEGGEGSTEGAWRGTERDMDGCRGRHRRVWRLLNTLSGIYRPAKQHSS